MSVALNRDLLHGSPAFLADALTIAAVVLNKYSASTDLYFKPTDTHPSLTFKSFHLNILTLTFRFLASKTVTKMIKNEQH